MAAKYRRYSVELDVRADVDISDMLDALKDDELADELRRRGKEVPAAGRELLTEALGSLLIGDLIGARALMERALTVDVGDRDLSAQYDDVKAGKHPFLKLGAH